MNKYIIYKDIEFYLSLLIEPIHQKLFHIFNIDLDREEKIYRLSFMVDEESNRKCSIDIYMNSSDKKLLFGTISNVLHGNIDFTELIFSNKLDQNNKGYYKLIQFVDYREPGITLTMKLKIYRDKNFVIIEPKVSYSYLPLLSTDLDINIYPVLLSENSIAEIKSECE